MKHFFLRYRKHRLVWIISMSFLALVIWRCSPSGKSGSEEALHIILDWNKFILLEEINTEGYRGPVAARAYAYIGLAAYEAALPGLEGDFTSLADRFPKLKLPGFPSGDIYRRDIALNECYAALLEKFFLSAPPEIQNEKLKLEKKWEKRFAKTADATTVKASEEYGRRVAEAIYDWSATDSLGYLANHHNFDRSYVSPVGEGYWVTSVDFPMPPLLPYWGKVRPFVIRTADFHARELPPFSTSPKELYHQQAMEIVSLTKPLSAENQAIAEFWNDDRPGLTFSPAGHWLAIATQVIEKERPSVEKTLETYLKVGFAMADAGIACFYSKYDYDLVRPETYIQDHIDRSWRPFLPTPPFPSYPSAHAMMGAAAARVLTEMYGTNYKLTDRSHDELKDFAVKPRSYTSFDAISKENAISRVYLGVHFRFDCEEGLRLGSLIGQEVSAIQIENPLTR